MTRFLFSATVLLPLLAGCGSGVHAVSAATVAVPAVGPVAITTSPASPEPPVAPSPAPLPQPVTTTPIPAPVPPVPVNTCVAFIGDSLTAYWPMSYFTGYDGGCYIDRGVGGTTLPQILDGIDDHALPYDATIDPATMHIVVIGGDAFNSINQLGMSAEQMEAQYTLILAKLRALGVQVILCTVLPSDAVQFTARVVELDGWIRSTAAAQNIPLVDLYDMPGLVMSDGMLSYQHTADGIHILPGDYGPFTPFVEAAIRQAATKP